MPLFKDGNWVWFGLFSFLRRSIISWKCFRAARVFFSRNYEDKQLRAILDKIPIFNTEFYFGFNQFHKKKRDMGGAICTKMSIFRYGNWVWFHQFHKRKHDILKNIPRCARLLIQKSLKNIYGCDLTENCYFEKISCVQMLAKMNWRKMGDTCLGVSGCKKITKKYFLHGIHFPLGNLVYDLLRWKHQSNFIFFHRSAGKSELIDQQRVSANFGLS